ncbi:MAG: archaetidylserine decarboxylase [Enterobacteriaceae bacterium]
MLDRIKITLQFWLPKLWLTRCAGWLAELQVNWLAHGLIGLFVRHYHVNMQEALQPDIKSYRTFNEFFIRPLCAGARPVEQDPEVLCLPADGMISQVGTIADGQLLQAKGHYYSLESLLAGNANLADKFYDGLFMTTYLSPRDYHRVHMPCSGTLREMIYVPGSLFSVNLLTADNVPNLFARNERLICLFDTEFGPMAQIMVGATIVGSIATVWAGIVTPPRQGIIQRWAYPAAGADDAITLEKGAEMGLFKLGSTVINLFAPQQITLSEQIEAGVITRMGKGFARRTENVEPSV